MKYSLRSLMVDAVLTVPFLVFGVFAVYCVRKAIQRYDDLRSLDESDRIFLWKPR